MSKENNQGNTMKKIFIFIWFLIIANSVIFSFPKNNLWTTKFSVAVMKPLFENDQWFVTEDGYHIHPRTEDFTPGLYLGLERIITSRLGIEIGALFGFPPATLGVIDQFSPTGREYLGTERYNFITIMVSPNLYLIDENIINIYFSPLVGYSISSEKVITPSFGPPITWVKNGDMTYGLKTGIKINTIIPNLTINSEIFMLNIGAKLESDQTGHERIKNIGPIGLMVGVLF